MTRYPTSFIFLAFALLVAPLPAQNFSKIDEQARAIPYSKQKNLRQLADALGKGTSTEKEKVRAIYTWICANIQYDVKSFENRKEMEVEEQTAKRVPEYVLKSKKAVCEGYANLFSALCAASGIEAIKVSGLCKNPKGRVSRVGHAWNLVRADGQWGLVDATWGAGDVDTDEGKYVPRFKEAYFFTAPETLIQDHYPDDPLFQLLPLPLTLDEFKQDRESVKKLLAERSGKAPQAHYTSIHDSLNTFVALDSTGQFYNSCVRAVRFDSTDAKGLYGLAHFQYNEAVKQFADMVNEVNSATQSRNRETAIAAYNRGVGQLGAIEANLARIISDLEKVSGANAYAKQARQVQGMARKSAAESAKLKENMLKTLEQLKK